jgi:hypothetical protein
MKWVISVRTHTKRKDILITSQEGESSIETYKRVKAQAARIRAQFEGKPVTVDVVSHTQAFPKPENVKIPRGQLWCPYCIKPRVFVLDDKLDVYRCSVCGISKHEFYVHKYNHMKGGRK